MLPFRGQSGPEGNGNEGVLCIPQCPSITGTSPSDCLVSYTGHLLGVGSYPSAEKQSVYSTAPADWAIVIWGRVPCCLPFSSYVVFDFGFVVCEWKFKSCYHFSCFFCECVSHLIAFNAHMASNLQTILFQIIQFSISMQFKCQNSSILNNSA